MKTVSLSLLLLFLAVSWTRAFPPAPYYTLYGMVRDQVGQTVTADGAVIILLKEGVEVGRTSVNSSRLDQNYEMNISIDQNRSGTTLYNQKAISAQGLFRLVVEMNGSRFYPIEVSGNLTAGQGGERKRLDLTLGEDLDHDGLPDAWEAWQLYQAGLHTDANGEWDLSLIDANGDFDHDGQSNLQEYIAGTFAGDATEVFSLSIEEKQGQTVRLKFFGITGKTYTLERSSDMKTWARVNLSAGAPGAGAAAYIATDVGFVSIFTTAGSATNEFYRLTVR